MKPNVKQVPAKHDKAEPKKHEGARHAFAAPDASSSAAAPFRDSEGLGNPATQQHQGRGSVVPTPDFLLHLCGAVQPLQATTDTIPEGTAGTAGQVGDVYAHPCRLL